MAKKKKNAFQDLVKIMARLRAPGGCPWDREQTHASLLKYLREESREVCEAVENKDWENLEEELADLLLQILFHSDLAREEGYFTIDDVLTTLKSKLVHRHPHVFGNKKSAIRTADDVRKNWAQLKQKERILRKAERQKRQKLQQGSF